MRSAKAVVDSFCGKALDNVISDADSPYGC
jgi:hypothetical protein